MPPVRVAIADDHGIVREGVKLALEALGGPYSVVAEVGDGAAVVRACRELEPDLVVLDVKMPLLDGVAASRQLAELPKPPKIIALSAHADGATVKDMLAAGAMGYVLKTEVALELVNAMRAIEAGRVYLSPSVVGCVVGLAVGDPDGRAPAQRSRLSAREQEVLLLVASGLSTKEIAAELRVSVKTVETQRKSVMEKLGIFSVAGLTKYAIREGLIEP
ncbi:MAG: response regulator transcription factor [Deltaproteobacteria bacterium]|nr:response regulator transcription factor [Deltaproteobacteria bacterium]